MDRLVAVSTLLLGCLSAQALEPNEIFLLVNKNVPASKEIAEHYCQKRSVPIENIILLDVPASEDIGRNDYDVKIVAPVRAALKDKKDKAKVLLSIYGVPLRVAGLSATPEENEKLKKLDPEIKERRNALTALQGQVAALEETYKVSPGDKLKAWMDDTKKTLVQKQAEMTKLTQLRLTLSHAESQACVDSELMLLWWDGYELGRWQLNLLYWQAPLKSRDGRPPFIMTCRLDGPSVAIVKGLVDQAIEVEKKGLDGRVYVDARGIRYDPKTEDGFGYGGYDESMREMAALLEKEGKMTVFLDDKGSLFEPLSCPKAALYCGWYSLAKFVDCCEFVPGAVAWHLASAEAVSLRQPDAKYWCKNLLEKGAIATLGPVAEPYTIGFPKPAEFFGFLATGKYTLVESYSRSVLFCSWMTVLVGDPLYNPFAANPRLKEEQVLPSPKGGKVLFK